MSDIRWGMVFLWLVLCLVAVAAFQASGVDLHNWRKMACYFVGLLLYAWACRVPLTRRQG